MSLILTILNKPSPGQEISSAFTSEGTIGRSADNNWVLVDPERLISSRHAQINNNNGDYFLTDLSTNGVFVNKSASPLGSGNNVKLNHGDNITIGQYEISVTIQVDASMPLSSPDTSPFGAAITETGNDGFAGAPLTSELGHVDDNSSLGMNDDTPLDPLAMLSSPGQATPAPTPGSIDDLGLGGIPSSSPFDSSSAIPDQNFFAGTVGDNASPMQQQFEPPAASPQVPPSFSEPAASPAASSAIPDDWNFGAAPSTPTVTPPPAPAAQPPASTPNNLTSEPLQEAIPDALSSIDDLLGAAPVASTAPAIPASDTTTPPSIPSPAQVAPVVPAAPAATPPPAPAQAPAPVTPAASTDEAMKNLLKGMGLEHLHLSATEESALALEAGQLIRTSIDGLVSVLRARASIKSEFRMSVTTIQAKENNPIKFSPTGIDALNHMFSTGNSSYMPAVQAVNEGFNDMEAHMIAVMAGMQTALHTVLRRFDPDMLERDFSQRENGKSFSLQDFSLDNLSLDKFSLGGKKAKYWDIYNTHYKAIIASVEDDFQSLFGDEFSRAYEEQAAKLKASRNSR